ncbi:MAG: PhoH family protein [Candidatus Pacebacteria bacterium]|nr:PhoH family protein [Candidatus Paceibacterota bacterium]
METEKTLPLEYGELDPSLWLITINAKVNPKRWKPESYDELFSMVNSIAKIEENKYKEIFFMFRSTMNQEDFDLLIEKSTISKNVTVRPLAYLPGMVLENKLLIVGPADNLHPFQFKSILRRADKGTKIVFIGDNEYFYDPLLDKSGLNYLTDKFNGLKLHGHIDLNERSKLSMLASKLL